MVDVSRVSKNLLLNLVEEKFPDRLAVVCAECFAIGNCV